MAGLAVTASAAPAPSYQLSLAAARFSPVSTREPVVGGGSTTAIDFSPPARRAAPNLFDEMP